MAADPTRLSYFSLPGEVRNKIVDHVLAPGDIYPWGPALEMPTRSPDTPVNIEHWPGIQLIATCKQAYLEGHELFYSSNTFHLPQTTTFRWADRLQAKHKAMIKRISISFGLVESTPAMLKQIERSMPRRVPQKSGAQWGEAMKEALLDLWKLKLRYIAAWTSLEEIELCSFGRICVLLHHDIVANLGRFDVWDNLYWRYVLWESRGYVFNNIRSKVDRVGWKKTKEWLTVKKPVGMAKGWIYGLDQMTENQSGMVSVNWRKDR